MSIKPIETEYSGYRFRSRLEARVAVFFDTLSIKFEYEVEGWDLHGTWYLPDFWLPDLETWVEVKSSVFGFQPMFNAKLATLTTHKKGWFGLVLAGTPEYLQQEQYGYYNGIYVGRTVFASCPVCQTIGLLTTPHSESFKDHYELPPYFYRLRCGCTTDYTFPFAMTNSKQLDDAFTKARQARFEFGETP